MRVDLRADLVAGGPSDVPTGSETGAVTLDGAVFDDGSTTAQVANGTAVPLRATGSSATLHVTASAVFSSLPYGDALDAVGDDGASQRLILARPTDARAEARADARRRARSPSHRASSRAPRAPWRPSATS
ncbi:hypothetical protein BC477_04195 [Clavibacter michiganensis subsp. michiganensis]|uniref:Uncharacterized protein n=1 Tax=Clavibacter michiganensis subsp. michiganensis TaxID=33013 RepID=A0A251XL29_CLAMM|nr:hypothetical protein BC477_04195 [Clavibacter michiganensis subsp. michiganensis]OUE03913.1 hypothetical protein CMMCAS07_03130 [Clavibacter michiganensis subsp. michiganensis]